MLGGAFLNRLDKFGMWILMAMVLGFVMTGYGMTKHIMDPVLAKYIHTQLLPLPLLIFFCIHVIKGVRNQFKKWKIFDNDRTLDIYAYALVLSVTAILIWLFFR
ncbi:MAG: hypothetical protein KGJ09_02530 [Candidatus Omnitrophica bacterium]|nr:hypothetical protein [Candidatus Omnitrophota bacterium]MDE2213502.1 hypothetical protein [Candidatus Omnitrophota bacterium]MDE2230597.1 hypothetical protein [Candidatus Omnitrophota bacterium]